MTKAKILPPAEVKTHAPAKMAEHSQKPEGLQETTGREYAAVAGFKADQASDGRFGLPTTNAVGYHRTGHGSLITNALPTTLPTPTNGVCVTHP